MTPTPGRVVRLREAACVRGCHTRAPRPELTDRANDIVRSDPIPRPRQDTTLRPGSLPTRVKRPALETGRVVREKSAVVGLSGNCGRQVKRGSNGPAAPREASPLPTAVSFRCAQDQADMSWSTG